MKIGLITYNVPHKKTQDIMLRLLGRDVTVIAMDFQHRKPVKPLYKHRPDMITNVSTAELCKYFNFEYIESNTPCEIIKWLDVGIIGGCGLINVNQDVEIINAHPGVLPQGRGLDALKWSIYNGHPVGVTTHVINNEVDSGLLIDQEIIEVAFNDSFYSVAMRQYNKEIEMIIKAIDNPNRQKIYNNGSLVNKRMPSEVEIIMMERFNYLRKKSNKIL